MFVTQLKIHLVDLRPDSDVKLENVKPQVIYWCFAFEKHFMSAQRSLSSLYQGKRVNENTAKNTATNEKYFDSVI